MPLEANCDAMRTTVACSARSPMMNNGIAIRHRTLMP
jgi:hypothetical protein